MEAWDVLLWAGVGAPACVLGTLGCSVHHVSFGGLVLGMVEGPAFLCGPRADFLVGGVGPPRGLPPLPLSIWGCRDGLWFAPPGVQGLGGSGHSGTWWASRQGWARVSGFQAFLVLGPARARAEGCGPGRWFLVRHPLIGRLLYQGSVACSLDTWLSLRHVVRALHCGGHLGLIPGQSGGMSLLPPTLTISTSMDKLLDLHPCINIYIGTYPHLPLHNTHPHTHTTSSTYMQR